MSRRRSRLLLWLVVILFAAGGFCIRLHLDRVFERLLPQREGIEAGFIDSFMMDASQGIIAREGPNE